jgi:hypothetical protein
VLRILPEFVALSGCSSVRREVLMAVLRADGVFKSVVGPEKPKLEHLIVDAGPIIRGHIQALYNRTKVRGKRKITP